MFLFITAIVLLIIAIGTFVARRMIDVPADNPQDSYMVQDRHYQLEKRKYFTIAAIAVSMLGGLVLLLSCLTVVSTKNVGIVTSFGKPTGSFGNGIHFKKPWEKVTEMDAAIQTDSHVRGRENEDCIAVRVARQSVACADTTIRWRIKQEAAKELFLDFRDFDKIRESLVKRELITALNEIMNAYDPLAVDAKGNPVVFNSNEQSGQITEKLRQHVGDRVEILSVFVPLIHFDESTQKRIDAYQAQVAETRIAQQARLTAEAQAQANKALAASVSNDPNVLVAQCNDILREMVAKGQTIPAGFSCWPGSGSAVVVPSAPAGPRN